MSIDLAVGEAQHAPCGLIGRIPIRNLWLLMLYASRLARYGDLSKKKVEDNPDEIPDLIAQILSHRVERRLKRNLSFGYRPCKSTLNRVRGRVDLLATERGNLLARGLVVCRYEDLTVNTPRNRFVRAALESISRIVNDSALASRCRSIAATLKSLGVKGEKPTRHEMSTDRIGRKDAADQFMLTVAALAFNLALPTEGEGSEVFAIPDRELSWVRTLYEKAIGGFYDVVLSPAGWSVEAGRFLNWIIEQKTSGIDDIMPTMKTDIILSHYMKGHRIVIDTKFSAILTPGRYREETIRSGHLYQIYAYIRSQENEQDHLSRRAAGLLLHPSIGQTIDETVVIQGHPIRFATVDLAAEARDIRQQLLRVVDFPVSPQSATEIGQAAS